MTSRDPRQLLERLHGLTRHLDAPGPPVPPPHEWPVRARALRDVTRELFGSGEHGREQQFDEFVRAADECAAAGPGGMAAAEAYAAAQGKNLADLDRAAAAFASSRTLAPSTNGHATTHNGHARPELGAVPPTWPTR